MCKTLAELTWLQVLRKLWTAFEKAQHEIRLYASAKLLRAFENAPHVDVTRAALRERESHHSAMSNVSYHVDPEPIVHPIIHPPATPFSATVNRDIFQMFWTIVDLFASAWAFVKNIAKFVYQYASFEILVFTNLQPACSAFVGIHAAFKFQGLIKENVSLVRCKALNDCVVSKELLDHNHPLFLYLKGIKKT